MVKEKTIFLVTIFGMAVEGRAIEPVGGTRCITSTERGAKHLQNAVQNLYRTWCITSTKRCPKHLQVASYCHICHLWWINNLQQGFARSFHTVGGMSPPHLPCGMGQPVVQDSYDGNYPYTLPSWATNGPR